MKHNAEDHFRLVHKIANRYSKGNRMEYDDIFQEGCIGLLRAIDEYKECNVPFGTFAGMHIQFAILAALRKSGTFRINPDLIWLASKIRKQDLIDSPPYVIAEELSKDVRYVERALEYLNLNVASLDYEYGNGKSNRNLTMLDSLCYEQNFDDRVYVEQMLDAYHVNERDKRLFRLVAEGHSFASATRLIGEGFKAANQRKMYLKRRVMHKKYLIYA